MVTERGEKAGFGCFFEEEQAGTEGRRPPKEEKKRVLVAFSKRNGPEKKTEPVKTRFRFSQALSMRVSAGSGSYTVFFDVRFDCFEGRFADVMFDTAGVFSRRGFVYAEVHE